MESGQKWGSGAVWPELIEVVFKRDKGETRAGEFEPKRWSKIAKLEPTTPPEGYLEHRQEINDVSALSLQKELLGPAGAGSVWGQPSPSLALLS